MALRISAPLSCSLRSGQYPGGNPMAVLTRGHLLHLASRHEALQRDTGKKIVDAIRERGPEIVGQAGSAILTVRGALAAGRVDALSHSRDDMGNADVSQAQRQFVTASGTANATQQARTFEFAEKLL